MRKFFVATALFCASWGAWAQSASNPVLMTIQGKPVTRGEFEYAYHKNNNVEGAIEQKSITEYLEMFINYKLKVAAAEALKMDTLTSFKEEFRTYRDLQLNMGLMDQAFIDSVAHSLYDDYAQRTGGQDVLSVAHILLTLEQNAPEEQRQRVAQRADSIYSAILSGAKFEAMAQQFSQDPGSAARGGQLPPIHIGMTIKEFEDQAYALKAGQMSRPFLSSAGYHIVWVKERKPVESYEALAPKILESLKRQGIEEAAAEHRIKALMSTGRTREAIMDSTLTAMTEAKPELKYLIQEYYDGLLLYEVAKQQVWDVAEKDEVGLANQFKTHKKKYTWSSPRFCGYIVSAKDKASAQKAQRLLKKGIPAGRDLMTYLKETINKDSVVVMARGRFITQRGENTTIDNLAFGDKKAEVKSLHSKYPITIVVGKVQKRPKTYEDVRAEVVADHQQALEAAWVQALRQRFSVQVNEDVLKTLH